MTDIDIDELRALHTVNHMTGIACHESVPIANPEQLSVGTLRALLDELQSLRAMKTAIEAAVNECEHSLLIWTDAAWNRTVAGDARDFCRAQFGRFDRLRTQLGLPPYQKPPFQEGPFSVVEAASDESFEHIRRQLDELRSAQQWRGIESAPKLITKNAALHAIRSLMHERPDESEKHRNWAILQAIDAVESLPATGADQ